MAPGNHTYSVSKPTFGTVSGNFSITNGNGTNVPVCLQGTPAIVAGGTTLVTEGCAPPNGVIDPGETVTATFNLMNNGGASTTSLVATLQSGGNVVPITTSQNYGVIAVGATVGKDFSFIANGAGACLVKSKARCSIHTSVVSNFSNTFSVTITP